MAVHAEGLDEIVVQPAAVSLAERGDHHPRNEPTKAGHLMATAEKFNTGQEVCLQKIQMFELRMDSVAY